MKERIFRSEDQILAGITESWEQLLAAIFNVVADPEAPVALVTAAFSALGQLAKLRQRGVFLRHDNLLKLCSDLCTPFVSPRDQNPEDFETVPLGYFESDLFDRAE
jgi:hypothetical protein